MFFFKRRKKKPLFGANIVPSCTYCSHNRGDDENIICSVNCEMRDNHCKKYSYNPLMREPKRIPNFNPNNFTEDDFSL